MAEKPEEKPTNTPDYGCVTDPFKPAAEPAKKAAATAPASDKE